MVNYVHFFSKSDLSFGYNWVLSRERIREVSSGNNPTEINRIIELWHIRRMIEAAGIMPIQIDEDIENLKTETKEYNKLIAQFFNSINPNNLKNIYETIEWRYKKTFWEIIDSFKLYKLISPNLLTEIITSNANNLRRVLECNGLVEKFKGVIRDALLDNSQSAQFLIEEFAGKKDSTTPTLHFPSNLTLTDKEQIINDYLDGKEPNLNYVRLISQVKDDGKEIVLSPKTRLKAEKLAKRINDEFWKNKNLATVHLSAEVLFSDCPDIQPLDIYFDEDSLYSKYTYSIPYIRGCDNFHRIGNCISLFGWLNSRFLLNLVNKTCEASTLEPLFVDLGRFAYPTFTSFTQKNELALYQLHGYNNVLKKMGSSFETELKQFYEIHLRDEFGYHGLSINLPRIDDSALNKCRIICPELDAIVKQYNTFVKNDEISKDIIRLSKPIKVEEGISLFTNKYYELADGNNELRFILWDLFGNSNSLLSYVKPFDDKNYRSLVDLLEKESGVLYSNYQDWQKPNIDRLIDNSIISKDANGEMYIADKKKVEVLYSLWEFGVCSYWYYDETEQRFLDKMFDKGWLTKDGHLLSKPERDYFSFYLNNSLFTNGFAYRNHYTHGSAPPVDDENKHYEAYLVFLRLLAIIILKIRDDLWLARRAIVMYSQKRKG